VTRRFDIGLAEHGLPAMLEPDVLLTSQYFDRVRRQLEDAPERMLMLAVLEEAVGVYLRFAAADTAYQQHMFAEAEAWIESEEHHWLFSFESICDAVGLEPGYMRRGLRAWKARLTRTLDPETDEPTRRATHG
jgi:hypothetical protein